MPSNLEQQVEVLSHGTAVVRTHPSPDPNHRYHSSYPSSQLYPHPLHSHPPSLLILTPLPLSPSLSPLSSFSPPSSLLSSPPHCHPLPVVTPSLSPRTVTPIPPYPHSHLHPPKCHQCHLRTILVVTITLFSPPPHSHPSLSSSPHSYLNPHCHPLLIVTPSSLSSPPVRFSPLLWPTEGPGTLILRCKQWRFLNCFFMQLLIIFQYFSDRNIAIFF